jgi:hypothetical protein
MGVRGVRRATVKMRGTRARFVRCPQVSDMMQRMRIADCGLQRKQQEYRPVSEEERHQDGC